MKGFVVTEYLTNYTYKILLNKSRDGFVSGKLVDEVLKKYSKTMKQTDFKKLIKNIDLDYQIPGNVLNERLKNLL